MGTSISTTEFQSAFLVILISNREFSLSSHPPLIQELTALRDTSYVDEGYCSFAY